MAKKPLITSRDPKGLHFINLCEAAYNKAQLDDERAQRLNERGDELQAGLAKLITKLSSGRLYADEEVSSSFTYPKGYKVKGIAEQVETLRELFWEFKDATYDESIATWPLPLNAEGWFAIPRWEKLGSTYGAAADRVLWAIGSKRRFYDLCEGQTDPEYLRQHDRSVAMWQKLGDEQKGHDILIVPCQLGFHHRGRSVRRAREVFTSNEFGLGAFEVGVMLLTHPDRLKDDEDLWIHCAGDENSLGAGGRFDGAPCFGFRDGRLGFGYRRVDIAWGDCGSASAFRE